MAGALNAPLAAQTGARVYGTVTDSVHRRALPGTTVTVVPLDVSGSWQAVADSSGRFALDSLPQGPYVVSARHAWLDSIGLAIPPDTITLVAGAASRVSLGVPSPATIYGESCHAPLTSGKGIIVGYVRSAESGAAVAGAAVGVLWNDFTLDMKTLHVHTFEQGGYVRTDSAGAFRACGIPTLKALTIQAQLDPVRSTGVMDAEIDSSGLLLTSFRLGVEPHTKPTGPYAISGIVKAEDGTVVPHPHVSLVGDTVRTTGDDEGHFRLTGLYPGTVGVQVQAIGYSPTRVTAEAGPGGLPVSVFLMPAAVMLDSVQAFARRAGVPAWKEDFDERLHAHVGGALMTAADIRQRSPHETTDLLRSVPWLTVNGTGLDAKVELRLKPMTGERIGVESCPQVYVDGVEWKADESLNLIAPSVLYGMEVYRHGEVSPAGYANPCGLIFFWTK
ncbi:MAG TPA: TonB-dependent receptor [Gemmatimonadaceae bacterium]|nr:TonB-dependent receptor [Gemmatimonadaceae bacterium]